MKEMFPDDIIEMLVSDEFNGTEGQWGKLWKYRRRILGWYDIRIIGSSQAMLCFYSYVKHVWH